MTDNLPTMTVDEYLQILRSSVDPAHNPFADRPALARAFSDLAVAASDFVDICRLEIPGDGYAESVGLLEGLVAAFPEPETIQASDLATLLAPLAQTED